MSLEEAGKSETATLRLVTHNKEVEDPQPVRRQFVNFAFYRLLPSWKTLGEREREQGKAEFKAVCDKFEKEMLLTTYSLVGLRKNVDLMLWRIGYDLDAFQDMTEKLGSTALGRHMEISENFLSMTKRSMYIDKFHPEHAEDRLHIIPGKGKYLFVYPFVKTRDWYMKSPDERQNLMDEHIRVGMKYRTVKLHTTYSFGLDDQEFVVAFETDEPQDFLDLVEELRFTQASKYTLRDTPMYTCRQRELPECLAALG
ncbi:MAG: chlorite dismutase family protein [Pyrinomonadaceae bacterium]